MVIKDLSPTQRALLRAVELALLAASFQGLLIILAQLGTGVTWNQIVATALGQAALVLMAVISKYLKASGQPLLSTLVNQAAQEATPYVAPVKLSTNEVAMQASFNKMIDDNMPQSDASQPGASFLSSPATPVVQSVAPAQQASAVTLMNTLPSIPTVQ